MSLSSRREAGRALQALLEIEACDPAKALAQYLPFLDATFAGSESLSDSDRLHVAIRHLYQKFRLFDAAYYRRRSMSGLRGWHNLAGAPKALNPLDHYVFYGRRRGYAPNPLVNPRACLAAYPDVAARGLDPVLYLVLYGWPEGRAAGARIDSAAVGAAVGAAVETGAGAGADSGTLRPGPETPRGRLPLLPEPAPEVLPGSDPAAVTKTRRGTLLLVSHDAGSGDATGGDATGGAATGGAAGQVVAALAEWLLAVTNHDIRIVAMAGGGPCDRFETIAPTFDIGAQPPETLAERLAAFAGGDVRAVVLNSGTSGGFLSLWAAAAPVVAYIHDLPRRPDPGMALIGARAARIIAASGAVRDALRDEFGLAGDRLSVPAVGGRAGGGGAGGALPHPGLSPAAESLRAALAVSAALRSILPLTTGSKQA